MTPTRNPTKEGKVAKVTRRVVRAWAWKSVYNGLFYDVSYEISHKGPQYIPSGFTGTLKNWRRVEIRELRPARKGARGK